MALKQQQAVDVKPVRLVLRAAGDSLPVNVVGASTGPDPGLMDRRIQVHVHHKAYEQIVAAGLFGLSPAARPATPAHDRAGNVFIELRLATEGVAAVGSSPAELRAWVAKLCAARADDQQVDAASWMVTAVGSTAARSRPALTLWHYLPDLSLDPDDVVGDTVAAAANYLRAEAPDAASGLGFDVATALLTQWLESSSLDPERAVQIVREEIANPLGPDADAELLQLAWTSLIEEGAKPSLVDSGRAIVYPIDGAHGQWHGITEQRDAETLVVFSLVPVELPADRFVDALEFTVRLNRDLAVSNFDLDVDTGELVLRTGIDVALCDDPTEMIRRAINTNAATLDDHLGAIEAFVSGSAVEECIAMIQPVDDGA